MKILYLPVIEPGANHETALTNKRGLYDALYSAGHTVKQLDYLDVPVRELYSTVRRVIDSISPDLLLTQLHGVDRLCVEDMKKICIAYPSLKIVNWSGDSWSHSLTSPEMLDLCHQFDLQLVAAPDVLPVYTQNGIHAHFWQIGYEAPVGPLPDMPHYDVVFLGNVISDKRRALLEFLRTLEGISVGIYGDWEHADGRNTYDFGAGEALYKNAKIAIADLSYPDQSNYVSNRPIQILMAGGAILLHEHVDKMNELLGIQHPQHYLEWHNLDELRYQIDKCLDRVGFSFRTHIDRTIHDGQAFAQQHHTYAARVAQLFDEFLPELEHNG